MARKKTRRQAHGSAWFWKQTGCWYYTLPGTTRRVPLTPFLKAVLTDWVRGRPKGATLFCKSDGKPVAPATRRSARAGSLPPRRTLPSSRSAPAPSGTGELPSRERDPRPARISRTRSDTARE